MRLAPVSGEVAGEGTLEEVLKDIIYFVPTLSA
jgi:hypothetical protein